MRWLRLIVMSFLTLPLFFAPPAAAADIELSTDAKGALFAVGQLTPSYGGARCVQVEWTGNVVPRLLGVAGRVTGGLAPYLVLQIEVGTGGGYASCNGFRGDVIYRGSLQEFGAAHPTAESQLPARRFKAEAGSATFRLTASVLDVNEAQSRAASAEFIFAALDESRLPAPTAEPTVPLEAIEPIVPVPPTSGGTPTTKDGESTTADPIRREGNLPADDPDRIGRDAGPAVTVPLTPKEEVPGILASPIRAVMHVVDGAREFAQQAAAPVIKGVAWGAWSLPTLLAFMLLQNYFDKRDPKLAQAPVFASPSLPFDDGYGASRVAEVLR